MIEMFLKVLHGNIAYSLLHSPNKVKASYDSAQKDSNR